MPAGYEPPFPSLDDRLIQGTEVLSRFGEFHSPVETQNFKRHEFACSCCGVSRIWPPFVLELQRVRIAFGGPMRITSGYRCPQRNAVVGGARYSAHVDGRAVDVSVAHGYDALDLVRAALECRITGVGVSRKSGGRGFVHLDMSRAPGKRPALWSY